MLKFLQQVSVTRQYKLVKSQELEQQKYGRSTELIYCIIHIGNMAALIAFSLFSLSLLSLSTHLVLSSAGALKRTPVGREATHHQFADVVKKWLRFAPFRQGGTGRRQTSRPAPEYMCSKFHTDTEGDSHSHMSPESKDVKMF